jgi:hypothetical protein
VHGFLRATPYSQRARAAQRAFAQAVGEALLR